MKLKIIFISIALFLFTGCTSLSNKTLGYSAEKYCTETTQAEKEVVRERMDEATYPHTVRMDCFVKDKEEEDDY